MRLEEKWIKWEPIKDLEGGFCEELICDGIDGLTIILSRKKYDEKIKLNINWRKFTSYTVTDETYLDKIFNDLRARDSTYKGGSFFKIINSEYLRRLSYSSGTLSDYKSFTHFVILTSDSVIDVIAEHEPKVELLK